MFTKLFWQDAGERAGKTFAQDLAAPLITATAAAGAGAALHVGWVTLLTNAGVAALISLLTSVVSLPVSGNGSASLLRAVKPGRHEAQ